MFPFALILPSSVFSVFSVISVISVISEVDFFLPQRAQREVFDDRKFSLLR